MTYLVSIIDLPDLEGDEPLDKKDDKESNDEEEMQDKITTKVITPRNIRTKGKGKLIRCILYTKYIYRSFQMLISTVKIGGFCKL